MNKPISTLPDRPTPIQNRFIALDAIRGFALFGIMFVNMTWFTGFAVLSLEQRMALGTERVDEIVHWLVEVIVAGKFWTIFAFLFGVGIAVQFSKQRDMAWQRSRYFKRIVVLLVLGLAHGIFLWFGDIISLYAVSGIVLFLFLSCSDKTRLWWGAGFLLLPIAQMAIQLLVYQQSGSDGGDPGHGPEELLAAFGSGNYLDVLAANWEFLKQRWLIAINDGRFMKITGLLLIGWWVGNQKILWQADKRKRLLKVVILLGLLVGLPANVIAFSCFPDVTLRPPSTIGLIVEVLKAVGIPILGLGYVAVMALGLNRWPKLMVVRMLAVVGRLSLTNYVMQTIVGIAIFYGYGFQQWGRVGMTWSIPIILSIFCVQILFSYLWLRHFKFGPLEWLCRTLIYGRTLPIRVTPENSQMLPTNLEANNE